MTPAFFFLASRTCQSPFASITYEHFLDLHSGSARELVVSVFESKLCAHFYIQLKRNDL
jgi:hypothetical protein